MLSTNAAHETLTRLTRLSQRREIAVGWLVEALSGRLEGLVESALEVTMATGDPLGGSLTKVLETQASSDLMERVMERCSDLKYRVSIPLQDVALVSTKAFVEECRARWPEPDEDQLAILAHRTQNLAYWFSVSGRREEALTASSEAVSMLRELAPKRPKKYLPGLATALDLLANDLSNLGRHKESLAASLKSVKLWRRLVKRRSTRSRRFELSRSLHNLAYRYHLDGRDIEAAETAEEAVRLRRQDVGEAEEEFPALANSLNNLAGRLKDLGRHSDALAASEEALVMGRRLAAERPDAFTHLHASSLDAVGNLLEHLGEHAKALAMTEESAALLRPLAMARPQVYDQDLAVVVHNLANRLSALGRSEEALARREEAIRMRRGLYEQNPEARRDLASSLRNFGFELAALRRFGEANTALTETVELYRLEAEKLPAAMEPELAKSLRLHAQILADCGHLDAAFDAFTEAVATIRSHLDRQPHANLSRWKTLERDYRRLLKKASREPDTELLARLRSLLALERR